MTNRGDDNVHHILHPFDHVLCQKTQHEKAVLLHENVFATIASVRVEVAEMVIAIHLDGDLERRTE